MRIDEQPIHFIHARSPNPEALPLLLVHGWPGSIFEFVKVIGPLTTPTADSGIDADAFHVVAPSIPGYGFSGPTRSAGWGPKHIAAALRGPHGRPGIRPLRRAGGDWGAIITTELARADEGRHLCGLHLTSPHGERPERADDELLSEGERQGLADWAKHVANGTVVHVQINSTRPHTLAFALNDSPAGLAAWLLDKYRSYSDCDGEVERSFTKDELLAHITTYWVTGTIASASRLYYERVQDGNPWHPPRRIEVPTGCSIFPRDVRRPSVLGRAALQRPAVGGDAGRRSLPRRRAAPAPGVRTAHVLPDLPLTVARRPRANSLRGGPPPPPPSPTQPQEDAHVSRPPRAP